MTGRSSTLDGAELVRFVRETLGCGCPDEVVARTVVDVAEGGEIGLDVGGRLLVRVLPSNDLDRLIASFPRTVKRLREERDRRGFRRLRLVVTHPEPRVVGEALSELLPQIAAVDDRVYVHTVTGRELPSDLKPEDWSATTGGRLERPERRGYTGPHSS